MKTKLIVTVAGLLLLIIPAQAAFKDMLANYIASINGVVAVLAKINNENDAKANATALDTAITAMKNAKAQLAAGNTSQAEMEAAMKEKVADMQVATASLHEQTHRIKRNKEVSKALAGVLAKLAQ
ncbi:MAG: hypothetical protein U0Q16_31595 [Bryobacteraceae bacterium]